MTLRIWRVTIDHHSAHFDSLDTASQFIRGSLLARDVEELPREQRVVMESIWMEEKEYGGICEVEDGAKSP